MSLTIRYPPYKFEFLRFKLSVSPLLLSLCFCYESLDTWYCMNATHGKTLLFMLYLWESSNDFETCVLWFCRKRSGDKIMIISSEVF